MNRVYPLIATFLALLSSFSHAEEDICEIRLSPDGLYFVGWFDHDAGEPFGEIRPIVFRSVSDPSVIFSVVSVPRSTQAEWNPASTTFVLADAPDNAGPITWLIHTKDGEQWITEKLDPFKSLYAEFAKSGHGAALFRPSILNIVWASDTSVSFHSYCNLGTYLITINTNDLASNPITKKLSDQFLEPIQTIREANKSEQATPRKPSD
jgi:hypothetical protein